MTTLVPPSHSYLVLLTIFAMSFILPVGAGMKPRFVDGMKNITVEMGQDATFVCVVSEIHGYRVGWVQANSKAIQAIGTHVITHNNRISVSHDDTRRKWMLHIAKAQLEDAGPYMCQLNTEPMKWTMGVLNVIIKPDIVDVTGVRAVSEGGNVRLVCEARGEPPPDVFWTRENKDKITVTHKTSGLRSSVSRVEGPVLELGKVRKSEAGSYLCIASNGHPPTVSRRVQLDVKFRPVVKVPVPKVSARAGTRVQMECNIEAFPRAELSWEFSSERGEEPRPVETDRKYNKEEFLLSQYSTRTVLTISNFSKEDVGLYVCGARNEMNGNGDKVDGIVYLNMDAAESSTVHYDMYFTEYEISLMPEGDRQVLYQEPSDWSPGSQRSHQFSTETPGGSRGQLGEERVGHTSLQAGEGGRRREHLDKKRHHGLLSSGSSCKGHRGVVFAMIFVILETLLDRLLC